MVQVQSQVNRVHGACVGGPQEGSCVSGLPGAFMMQLQCNSVVKAA
jgi:hypothetical protein